MFYNDLLSTRKRKAKDLIHLYKDPSRVTGLGLVLDELEKAEDSYLKAKKENKDNWTKSSRDITGAFTFENEKEAIKKYGTSGYHIDPMQSVRLQTFSDSRTHFSSLSETMQRINRVNLSLISSHNSPILGVTSQENTLNSNNLLNSTVSRNSNEQLHTNSFDHTESSNNSLPSLHFPPTPPPVHNSNNQDNANLSSNSLSLPDYVSSEDEVSMDYNTL